MSVPKEPAPEETAASALVGYVMAQPGSGWQWSRRHGPREVVNAALGALKAAGYRIVKQEEFGWTRADEDDPTSERILLWRDLP